MRWGADVPRLATFKTSRLASLNLNSLEGSGMMLATYNVDRASTISALPLTEDDFGFLILLSPSPEC